VTPALVLHEARDVASQLKASIPRIIAAVTRDVGTHQIVHTMQAAFERRIEGIERVASET
jgi:hypothetical protein